MTRLKLIGISILLAGFNTFAFADTPVKGDETIGEIYSTPVKRGYPDQVYWGDTHVHTNLSTDAYTRKNEGVTPEMAYQFARGETVTSGLGQPARLSRPLDFIVLTDHAEFLGLFPLLGSHDATALNTKEGKQWAHYFDENNPEVPFYQEVMAVKRGELTMSQDSKLLQNVWHQVTAAADRNNRPGLFTAFIGYEWTSMPQGNNLHRNIIFRDDASRANAVVPFSAMDSLDPEQLWAYLNDYETRTGGRVLAIPHNGNGSNGLMFLDKTLAGAPLTKSYAATRARWEPLVEVTQIKGDGESHPYLSPDDPFADFERWDKGNFAPKQVPKENWMYQHEYARGALAVGLRMEEQLGVNPFKFGMIGSSDAHTSLAATEENNYFGKYPMEEPSSHRGSDMFGHFPVATEVASGYAAIWAQENTRESLFDAMQRRETYASTGPRMVVRLFGGWDFEPQEDLRPDYAARGYAKGVPMGGDLTRAPQGKAPMFLIVASKDPQGANLDRIQMVKGWLKADGTTAEKIYNVAVSSERTITNNEVAAVKSTVDITTATYTNSVGDPQLSTVWKDPDFDPDQRAFYYVRVLEIPTPRWTTYDAAFYKTPLPSAVPPVIQERAYTSPIWYTP